MTRLACKDIPDREVLRLAAAWQDWHARRPVTRLFPRIRLTPGAVTYIPLTPEPPCVYDALAQRYPPKVAWAKLERLARRGYLEYGVSLRCAWPTERGRAVLR